MSDTSLNEVQPKLIKLDKSEDESGLLTNLSKKSNSNSIFVVPSQQTTNSSPSSSNLTTVTLVNDSQKSNAIQNKITVVPININTQKTAPIKIIQDLNATSPVKTKTTIISSLGNSKKLIQINPSSPSNSNLSSSPIRANNIIINSSDKSPQSQKILTITNGLNTSSNISNANNKIQYVKIVNTPSSVSSNTGSSPNNSNAIKITTISANNNSNNTNINSNSIQVSF